MERRDRFYGGLAVVVIILGMSIGCNPGSLSMLLMPFSSDKVQPRCKIASKDKHKEVTVAIVCSFAANVTRAELIAADQDLADKLHQTLTKNFKDNKEKVKIVPPSKVRAYQNRIASQGVVSDQAIGKHFKVDYVISVDITDLDLDVERTRELFRGKIDLAVRALDLSKLKGEGQEIFEDNYTLLYPGLSQVPFERSGTSPGQFRAQLMNRVARDLARWFSAVPQSKGLDMD